MVFTKFKWWVVFLTVSGLLFLINLRWQLPFTNSLRHLFYQVKVNQPDSEVQAEVALINAENLNLLRENERLRDLLGAPLPPAWQFMPGAVINLEKDLMTINLDATDSLKVGQTVFAYQKDRINNGVVLGKVSELESGQAKVRLLFSPSLSIKAATAAGASGIVTGDGQFAWLNQVVQADRLVVGDLVLTAGGDGFLPGLVLGRVGEIVKMDTAVYQQAKLDLVIDPRQLTRVWIVSD